MVKLTGYQILEKIYSGSRTQVYRGIRESDQKPVAIKLLQSEYPSFKELTLFRNQYTIAKNLEIPGIIQTYNLENCENGYALVMEFGGISLKDYAIGMQANASLKDFFHIALKIVAILDGLIRHRVIHKDIKPANILINPTTREVKLIDFGIASLLPRETQVLASPQEIEGTLAYLSPEQTGRMNRGIDYRSDFYSLGVTFFELLTGQLPFDSLEPMELVHCHLAKLPPLVHSINSQIPPSLSQIVNKLMAKNAEDRYQSALGIEYDLKTCWRDWDLAGIETFGLGQRDVCDRFVIPEKLYGREEEVATLLDAFDRVTHGSSEMMLVTGFSGIGKTAVVNEVHKPITVARGYFIKGKFDQFQRNIPLSAFVQALRNLMGQLLTESSPRILQWKTQILQAVGTQGKVIIDVIPELEKIVGEQPLVPEVSGITAQNRFNLLFVNFIQVFSSAEHPLVIFIDDLQWADLPSLQLIKLLMVASDSNHLLLIGAYRDNEVSVMHPLILTLDEIRSCQVTVKAIALNPLSQSDLNYLVADTLKSSLEQSISLTKLVYQLTDGNPFFSSQLLKTLYEEKFVSFDLVIGIWQWDINKIQNISLAKDVVEFMRVQLQKLPQTTQNVLKLAACIGNQFDLNQIAIVSDKSLDETASDLWQALLSGLIIPIGEYKFYQDIQDIKEFPSLPPTPTSPVTYKFLHDRVQQAAYLLIPQDQKQSTHLKIGQLLLSSIAAIEREEKIFEIVSHLNMGVKLITSQTERVQLAQLNLIAGRKARNSTAYAAAIEYFTVGISVLAIDCWQRNYELTLSLYEEAAEAAYLAGDHERMEELVLMVLQKAKTQLDKVKVYMTQILADGAQGKALEAINTAFIYLNLLGLDFCKNPTQLDIQRALEETTTSMTNLSIENLIFLPEMTAAQTLVMMQMISTVLPLAYAASPNIFVLMVVEAVKLLLAHGNCRWSSFICTTYGMILCGIVQDIDSGYKFGLLAERLLAKFPNKETLEKNRFLFNCFIRHWKQHFKESLNLYQTSYSNSLEIGDTEYAAYTIYCSSYTQYFIGEELTELQKTMRNRSEAIRQIRQKRIFNWHEVYRQAVLNLLGDVENPCDLIGVDYNEVQMIPFHVETNDGIGLFCIYFCKLQLCYLFAKYTQALENADMAEKYLYANIATTIIPQFYFYDSLVRLAVYPHMGVSEQKEIIDRLQTNQSMMQHWSDHAPMNYLHKFYLVEAERYRVLGNNAEAIEYYNRAIASAQENGYLNDQALAYELSAKFYQEWGKDKIARVYLADAYYSYLRWGAKAKVDDLEKRYPQLLAPILNQQKISHIADSSKGVTTTSVSGLDIAAVVKASQAISGEIHLEKLLSTLLRVVVENAGAQKCVLILPNEENCQIAVLVTGAEATLLQSIPIDSVREVPQSVINYVLRTSETLVMDDARVETMIANDSYISLHQPQSILCTPIQNQGKLIGILYLENNLTTGAFTSDRLQVLRLLTAQVAISLENAWMHNTLEQKVQQRTQELNEKNQDLLLTLEKLKYTQTQLVQAEKMSGLGQLVAGVAHEINNPVNFISANLTPASEYVAYLFELINLYQQHYYQPVPEIQEKIADIDLDFLLQDLPQLLLSMEVGATRIKEIILSLRNFSRLDEAEMKPVDIHSGIDSTLLILQHRLKANDKQPEIVVIKDYAELPLVNCYASQLNQVFMNLLGNALDAVLERMRDQKKSESADSNSGFPPQINFTPAICIRTEAKSESVLIRIADNGTGISDDVKTRIFDPFFTTKPVGSGTGLGLSISYSIVVEKHGGQLTCTSTPQGTEFVIKIPQ